MIKSLKAKEVLDSRRNPTVEVELETDKGVFKASVPSGASCGKYEAVELRDKKKPYQGMGVLKAIKNVNDVIGSEIKDKDETKQKEIDELMSSGTNLNTIEALKMAMVINKLLQNQKQKVKMFIESGIKNCAYLLKYNL